MLERLLQGECDNMRRKPLKRKLVHANSLAFALLGTCPRQPLASRCRTSLSAASEGLLSMALLQTAPHHI
eukprot:5820651-Amphidinium_carterae.1